MGVRVNTTTQNTVRQNPLESPFHLNQLNIFERRFQLLKLLVLELSPLCRCTDAGNTQFDSVGSWMRSVWFVRISRVRLDVFQTKPGVFDI